MPTAIELTFAELCLAYQRVRLKLVGMVQNVGNQLTGYALLTWLLARGGTSVAAAIGLSWTVAFLGLLHMLLLRKTHDAMGVDKRATVYPWLAIQPVVIAFTLL